MGFDCGISKFLTIAVHRRNRREFAQKAAKEAKTDQNRTCPAPENNRGPNRKSFSTKNNLCNRRNLRLKISLVPWCGAGHDSHYFGHRVALRCREGRAATEAHNVNPVC